MSTPRTSAQAREAKRPKGLRAGLVAACALFWLGTALFPCCELIAATLGGDRHREVAQSDSATPYVHPSGGVQSKGSGHDPHPPCEQTFSDGAVSVEEPAVLTSVRFPLQRVTVEEPHVSGLAAVVHRSSLALPRVAPPPPGFQQRSQRLLI